MRNSEYPIISVIVPVYKVEEYLPQCMESLIHQSFPDIEIVCIDDCSPDGSSEILKRYQSNDSRVRVVANDVNKGLAESRNVGIKHAHGEYLIFVDSDDFVDLSLCEKVANSATQAQFDVLIYGYKAFSSADELRDVPLSDANLNKIDLGDRARLLELRAYAWAKAVRRDFLRHEKIEFPQGLTYEDIPVHWKLLTKAVNIAVLPERLYFYRQRPSSISYHTGLSLTDSIRSVDIVKNHLQHYGLYDLYQKPFIRLQLNIFSWVADNIEPKFRGVVKEMALKRLTDDHRNYIEKKNDLLSSSRDYYLSLYGGVFPALRRLGRLTTRQLLGLIRH